MTSAEQHAQAEDFSRQAYSAKWSELELPNVVAILKATADELESVWRSLGQINPNRHVIAAREALSKLPTLN